MAVNIYKVEMAFTPFQLLDQYKLKNLLSNGWLEPTFKLGEASNGYTIEPDGIQEWLENGELIDEDKDMLRVLKAEAEKHEDKMFDLLVES